VNAATNENTTNGSGSLTVQFAAAARLLNAESQRFGLDAPSFRSPPRVVGVDRTVRRREHGGVVAVALRDRPFVAVLGDMIEGVIVVNRLVAPVADQCAQPCGPFFQYAVLFLLISQQPPAPPCGQIRPKRA